MPRALVRKQRGSLWAAEPNAEEALAKVKDGSCIWIEWKRLKSPKHMALYFSMLKKVHDALPERFDNIYPTVEAFRKSLEVESGFGDPLHTPDGVLIGYAPRSVARIGQDEFDEVFKGVTRLLYQNILPEIGSPELEALVDKMLADRRYEGMA